MGKETVNNWKELPLLLNAKDVQKILRVNRNHVYNLFHQKSFPNITIGKRLVIEKNTFKKWLERQSNNEE